MRHALSALVLLGLAACAGETDPDDTSETDTDVTGDTDGDTDADTDGDTDVTSCTVTPPATWSAPEWDANTTVALALRNQVGTLAATTMREAEQGTTEVELADLTALYEAGDPSIADVASTAIDELMGSVFVEFVEVLEAGEQDLVNDAFEFTPGAEGGIFEASDRGINEGGLEVRQLVDKGLFAGGALYPWALQQTEGTITPATIDAIAAAWGANSALDPEGDLDDSANYGQQMGFHGTIADALVAAKAYAADDACTAERDEALVTVFRNWELSMMARFVFYANAASDLLAAPGSDADVASALHELGEGLGLGIGFFGLEDPAEGPLAGAGRVVTNADIDEMATALGVNPGDLGASTTGGFVSDPGAFADAVIEVEDIILGVYGLEASDIASYRDPVGG